MQPNMSGLHVIHKTLHINALVILGWANLPTPIWIPNSLPTTYTTQTTGNEIFRTDIEYEKYSVSTT